MLLFTYPGPGSILQRKPAIRTVYVEQQASKSGAFKVLQIKCNSCHATKKRTDVFTWENMDSLATDIWKQVFVRKKMPKGRKINLTQGEATALQDWLDQTLKE